MSSATNPPNDPAAEPVFDDDDIAPIELTEILTLPLSAADTLFSASAAAPALANLRQTLLAELLEQLQPLIDKELQTHLQPVFDELIVRLKPALEAATQQLVEDAVWRALSSVLDRPTTTTPSPTATTSATTHSTPNSPPTAS